MNLFDRDRFVVETTDVHLDGTTAGGCDGALLLRGRPEVEPGAVLRDTLAGTDHLVLAVQPSPTRGRYQHLVVTAARIRHRVDVCRLSSALHDEVGRVVADEYSICAPRVPLIFQGEPRLLPDNRLSYGILVPAWAGVRLNDRLMMDAGMAFLVAAVGVASGDGGVVKLKVETFGTWGQEAGWGNIR